MKFEDTITRRFRYKDVGAFCPTCYFYGRLGNINAQIDIEIDPNWRSNDIKPFLSFGIRCPMCHNFNVIEVDVDIVSQIATLNQLGFFTVYSCAGHIDDDNNFPSSGYIKFENLECLIDVLETTIPNIQKYVFYSRNNCQCVLFNFEQKSDYDFLSGLIFILDQNTIRPTKDEDIKNLCKECNLNISEFKYVSIFSNFTSTFANAISELCKYLPNLCQIYFK